VDNCRVPLPQAFILWQHTDWCGHWSWCVQTTFAPSSGWSPQSVHTTRVWALPKLETDQCPHSLSICKTCSCWGRTASAEYTQHGV